MIWGLRCASLKRLNRLRSDAYAELETSPIKIHLTCRCHPTGCLYLTSKCHLCAVHKRCVHPRREYLSKPARLIRDADVTSDSGSLAEAPYHLLLDVGFTEKEAVVLLFLDSVLDVALLT